MGLFSPFWCNERYKGTISSSLLSLQSASYVASITCSCQFDQEMVLCVYRAITRQWWWDKYLLVSKPLSDLDVHKHVYCKGAFKNTDHAKKVRSLSTINWLTICIRLKSMHQSLYTAFSSLYKKQVQDILKSHIIDVEKCMLTINSQTFLEDLPNVLIFSVSQFLQIWWPPCFLIKIKAVKAYIRQQRALAVKKANDILGCIR